MPIFWTPAIAGVIGDLLPSDLHVLAWGRWPLIGLGAAVLVYLVRRKSTATVLQLAGEVAIVVPAYFAYFMTRGLVQGRETEAFHRAIDLIELEQTLGIFWEPDLQEYIMRFGWLVNIANWAYIWGHWPVIVLVALWLFMLHREVYPVYRNAFIISGAIGLVIFTLMPVAPPRFLDAWGFVDTVAERSQAYRVLQPPAFVNQYAAMPSLHFGWNLLVGIAILRHGRGLLAKVFGIGLPVVMFASIVFTANHYIIDGIAGGSLALVCLFAAIKLQQFLQRRTNSQPPAAVAVA
ncbi:MAG: phosphatase PAP2 family protein [Chloroflexi bacterium]|nr:phosphatase PAP2 family protein [Chloroflexota bacterium]